MQGSGERVRAELAERLRARRAEVEQAVLTRVNAISDLGEADDPSYADGLRTAVVCGLDHSFAAIEQGDGRPPSIPVELLAQARRAGRGGISLDTVLRRYFAGYALLSDFLIEEAQKEALMAGSGLKRVLRTQANLFDRLLKAVSEEHAREAQKPLESLDRRHCERVERLLAGELLDTSELAYDFNGWHVGVIATGVGAADGMRDIARSLDCSILIASRPGRTVWAWLGARRRCESLDVLQAASPRSARLLVGLGEPGQGIAGWRLTHRQARAALLIARRSDENPVRYGEVVLLASMARDDLLVRSLRELFIEPLFEARDGGEVLRRTLRAYFAAGRNAASAAAALGISRQAVSARLRNAEELLGRPLGDCAAEMEAALRMEELSPVQSQTGSPDELTHSNVSI